MDAATGYYSTFAVRLRAEMDKQHITQTELAEKAGLSRSAVSQVYNGNTVPKLASVIKICDALGVTEAYLTGKDSQSTDDLPLPKYPTMKNIGQILLYLAEYAGGRIYTRKDPDDEKLYYTGVEFVSVSPELSTFANTYIKSDEAFQILELVDPDLKRKVQNALIDELSEPFLTQQKKV